MAHIIDTRPQISAEDSTDTVLLVDYPQVRQKSKPSSKPSGKPLNCLLLMVVVSVIMMVVRFSSETSKDGYRQCEFHIVDGVCQYKTAQLCTEYEMGIRIEVVHNAYAVYSIYDGEMQSEGSVEMFKPVNMTGSAHFCMMTALTQWEPDPPCGFPGSCDEIWVSVWFAAKIM